MRILSSFVSLLRDYLIKHLTYYFDEIFEKEPLFRPGDKKKLFAPSLILKNR